MAKRLDGKVAIITGAGGGIGRQTALLLGAEGASVLVNDLGTRTGADAQSVVDEIVAAGGKAVANTDSAVWANAEKIVAHAMDAFGRIDILINNATAGSKPADMWDVTEADWDKSVDVNLKGYFAMIRAVAPHFCTRGSGAIVNMSSGAGFGQVATVAYSSGKEGVVGLTRTVARELGRFGVRCNAIRPLALAVSSDEALVAMAKWQELMMLTLTTGGGANLSGTATPDNYPPAKIAPMMVWLCTDAANEVNGRTFHVRGDTIALFTEKDYDSEATEKGGWSLDSLDAQAPTKLIAGLKNDFTFTDRPDLRNYDGPKR